MASGWDFVMWCAQTVPAVNVHVSPSDWLQALALNWGGDWMRIPTDSDLRRDLKQNRAAFERALLKLTVKFEESELS